MKRRGIRFAPIYGRVREILETARATAAR